MRRLCVWFVAASLAAAAACAPTSSAPITVIVFAAASLKTALDECATALDRDEHIQLTVSYAASSALAKQIDAGAPAEIFISADVDWMDYVAARDRIRSETRVDLLGNALVLIAPSDHPISLALAPGVDLAAALGGGRLAVANPDVVPAGKYAKAALTTLGVWATVEGHLAPAEDVRAALQLVARGEAPLGIVYRTDAMADARVSVVATFATDTHAPIVYPVALTRLSTPAAGRALTFLEGAAARAVFERNGFMVLTR
jgi:molybdate transport system substrate-binding protein